jgi:hypothetical protein
MKSLSLARALPLVFVLACAEAGPNLADSTDPLGDSKDTPGVDQLLDSASRASWHILDVTGVTAEGAMIASGIRLADNATMTMKLSRIP